VDLTYKRPSLTDYQKAIIDCEARYTVTEASTKAGKTASHMIWLFEQAWRGRSGMNFWWIAPVYSQAKIAFNRFKSQLNFKTKKALPHGLIGHEVFYKENKSELSLTMPNGAVIWFKSADNPDTLYGDDVHAAVFDEFTRAKQEAWFALRSTLTATGGRCKFIGNVKGKGNWGYKLAQMARQEHGNGVYAYFRITAYDAVEAGILTLEEVEDARINLPEHVFKALYLAEASDDGTNPFGERHIFACQKPLSELPAVCYGVDLAKSVDYTAIVGLDAYGNVCHLERFQLDWHATKLRILALPLVPTLVDSTGVGDPVVEDLQRENTHIEGFKFTRSSKQQLIEGLAVAIQQQLVGLPEGVLVEELLNFEYEHTRTGTRYTAPEGMHDDCVIALGLAYKKYKEINYTLPLMPIASGAI
jgi:hypothetical protein